jgi:arogenate dehydrogenase (NADP+)
MKVGIIGLGLIGGSLGLDLRKHGIEILGISRNDSTCQRALERDAIDRASTDFGLLKEAEIVFICTPIAAIASTLKQIEPFLNPETIVTDVGSVKVEIVSNCSSLWDNFVGGHPMAGTAEQGIEAAQTDLFVDAPYVLTPTDKTDPGAIALVETVVSLLKSKIYLTSPEIHDRAVAWISHLPVQVSANLIHSCTQETDPEVLKLAQNLASSGFRDTSRVGGGNPELGLMMAQYNTKPLLRSLEGYRKNLDKVIDLIQNEQWKDLESFLESTQKQRPKFLE